MKQKSKRPAHRPQRRYPDAERVIVECELEECVHWRVVGSQRDLAHEEICTDHE